MSLCLSLSLRWATLGQNDRALRLPLLQGVTVWEEVCSERGESLLCEMLWEPVLQHLWGVQEAHWLQHQGKRCHKIHKSPNTLFVWVPVMNTNYHQIIDEALTVHLMFLQDLSYKDRHWHEDCFMCFQCKRSLVDKPFSTKDEQLLCTECYSNEYSSKCHECKKTIMPGRKESNIFKLNRYQHSR